MNQKNSISFIDLVLVTIIIFYMEYRICLDLLKIYISGEIYLIYLVISSIYLIFLTLFIFYISKCENRDISFKETAKRLFIAILYCIMHVLLLVGFIDNLNYIYLLILQIILISLLIIFGAFIFLENKFDINNFFLFSTTYIVFLILISSVLVLRAY